MSRREEAASLNQRRDRYTRGMRELVVRFHARRPDRLKGILGRSEAILAGQLPTLEELEALDLDAPCGPLAQRDVLELLLRAQHLPRVILAFGEVLDQEEKSQVLWPVQAEALALGQELAAFTQDWLVAHRASFEMFDDEDLV